MNWFSPVWRMALICVICLGAAPAQALSAMDPFNVAATLDPGSEQKGRGISYGSTSRQTLDVYTPTEGGQSAPVLMFIYGGGWNRGEKADYEFVGRALAARGFVTVVPDYRLVPEVTFPAFVQDCASAVKWIEDNIALFGGDPTRIYILGHSAGAYDAIMLGLDPNFLREAGVTQSIKGIAALSGPYDFYPFSYDEVRNAFGGSDNPQMTQPVNLVSDQAPPIFLGTGTSDPVVRPVNTQTLAGKLRDAGTILVMNTYEGLTHMEPILVFSTLWRWRAPVMEDVMGFFTDLGAFDDGRPRETLFPPAPPEQTQADRMREIVDELDALFTPIETGP